MLNTYNVLIVGAGNIAAGFDSPSAKEFLTHAHGFSAIKGFKLVGFVEINKERGKLAAEKWNAEVFSTLEEAFKSFKIDVVCVAVPDDLHYEILMEVVKYPVKFIFIEKPLVNEPEQLEKVKKIFSEKKIAVGVNFTRRFVSEFKTLKNNIISGEYGNYITGGAYYCKGILHNGSHLIDILRYLIGEVTETTSHGYILDWKENDPSVSVVLKFENECNFFIQSLDSRQYSFGEIDLFFEKQRIRIIDGGSKIEFYDVVENNVFKGYNILNKTNVVTTDLCKATYYSALNIYDFLEKGVKFEATLEDSLRVLEICFELQRSVIGVN